MTDVVKSVCWSYLLILIPNTVHFVLSLSHSNIFRDPFGIKTKPLHAISWSTIFLVFVVSYNAGQVLFPGRHQMYVSPAWISWFDSVRNILELAQLDTTKQVVKCTALKNDMQRKTANDYCKTGTDLSFINVKWVITKQIQTSDMTYIFATICQDFVYEGTVMQIHYTIQWGHSRLYCCRRCVSRGIGY